MNTLLITLVTVLFPPVIAGIVGVVTTRSGITGKLKEVEFQLKKLELLNQLLSFRDKYKLNEIQKYNWEAIDNQLLEVLSFIQKEEEVKAESKVVLEKNLFDKIISIFILPKPITTGGWIFTVVYYMYGITTLMYISFIFFPPSYIGTDLKDIIPSTIIGGFILTILGRYYSLRSWRKKMDEIENAKKQA